VNIPLSIHQPENHLVQKSLSRGAFCTRLVVQVGQCAAGSVAGYTIRLMKSIVSTFSRISWTNERYIRLLSTILAKTWTPATSSVKPLQIIHFGTLGVSSSGEMKNDSMSLSKRFSVLSVTMMYLPSD